MKMSFLILATSGLLLFAAYSSIAQTDSTNDAPESPALIPDSPSFVLPSPLLSLPFPSSEWPNSPVLGVSADAPDYAMQKVLALAGNKSRIKIYGWVAPSYTYSTSKDLNIPVSYNIIPNSFELDQAVLRIERQPNTVQREKIDWGFRMSNMYGLDYRYTVAKGWFSDQYFEKNNKYGYDAPELYGLLYFPKIAQGMMLKVGRFIAPADIEAQLAPDNYLFSHSVMFSYDPFTFTGIQSTIKLSRQWQIQVAVHGGNDMSVWTNSSAINGQGFVRYVSKNNNNSLWLGLNSLGPDWKYRNAHDNLQMAAGIWGHKFSEKVHMMTEAYYEWERDAATGGSASNGPVRFGAGGGPGAIIDGISSAIGVVNYFQILTSKKSYISIRNDYLNDMDGWRTGFKTTYTSHTIGYIHWFTPWLAVRPEVRYDRTWTDSGLTAYDLGTRRDQWNVASDIIVRF